MHELSGDALILGDEAAGEVERAPGHMRVNVHATWEDHHAGRVNRADAAPVRVGHDTAVVGNADVLHDAFDAVGRIVDFSARYPHHAL